MSRIFSATCFHARKASIQTFFTHFTKTGPDQYAVMFSYASCGILLIFLNQGYTDQTCVMSKVFVDLVEISANKKMRKGKEPGYDCIEIWPPSRIQREGRGFVLFRILGSKMTSLNM